MKTKVNATFVPKGKTESGMLAQDPGKTPRLQLQTSIRAGSPNSDEAWVAANWDRIEQWFNGLQARFGTNI